MVTRQRRMVGDGVKGRQCAQRSWAHRLGCRLQFPRQDNRSIVRHWHSAPDVVDPAIGDHASARANIPDGIPGPQGEDQAGPRGMVVRRLHLHPNDLTVIPAAPQRLLDDARLLDCLEGVGNLNPADGGEAFQPSGPQLDQPEVRLCRGCYCCYFCYS
jgi:hypothetical protein